MFVFFFCCQAEDGIRDLVRSRWLGDVYKRQGLGGAAVTLYLILLQSIASLSGIISGTSIGVGSAPAPYTQLKLPESVLVKK